MNDLRTETILVKGMFCTNCERKVQEALSSLPGVRSAAASFTEETVTVLYDGKQVSSHLIKQEIEKLGYETVSDSSRYIQIVSILIILLALYVIASHLGWTRVFNIFPNIEASLDLGMLFVIGLLTSVHCIAMCGGINLTQSTMAANGGAGVIRSNLAYNAGRVISYTVIGGIVGGIGSVVSFSGALKGAVTVVVGVIMIVMSLSMLGVFSGKLNRKKAGIMLTVSAILIFVLGIHMTENGLVLSGISPVSNSRNESVVMADYFGDKQYIKTEVDYGSYEAFTVRKGIPVEWIIVVPEGKLNGCNGEIVVPAFDLSIKLHEGENTVSFTPNDVGTIPYSCWMGMIKSSINVVD